MKHIFLSLCLAVSGIVALAQKSSINWGDEIKLRKGSSGLEIIFADNTGAYLQESHMIMQTIFSGASTTFRGSAILIKMDKNLKEVYRNNFNRELKGKEFRRFFACQDKLFLFASDYSKRHKTVTIYAAAVDKNSGELTGGWKAISVFQMNEKKDNVNFKIDYNVDSTKILIVSSLEGTERNEYKIQELDLQLKTTDKPLVLQNEFEPKKYQLEDVLYTNDRNVILVGRMYEYEEGKKKKEKFLDFTNYNIRIYNEKGKQKAEINTGINGKWLSNTKLVQEKNKDLVLAAFYSNEKKGKTIDGLLVQRINVADGKVVSTSDKQISNSMLSVDPDKADDNDQEDKKDKKGKKKSEELKKTEKEGEGFSKYMQFRNIFYTADNGLVILAERYNHYETTSTSYSPGTNNMPGQWTRTISAVYISGDLMICKVDASGNIGWLQIIPKKQREDIPLASLSGSGSVSYFIDENGAFYSGFCALQANGSIQLLFNDHPKNIGVTQVGQKTTSIFRFSKSDCFLLSIDEISGKVDRKVFFSNADIPTAMPRLGVIIGNDMYLVGKTDKVLGKSKVSVGKITIK